MINQTNWISITLLLGTASLLPAQVNLTVNLSDSLRPVTRCASGSLYGITETLPTDIENLVAPLKPHVFAQPALSGTGRQQPIGAAIPVARRLAETTGRVQVRLADVLPGWPYRWSDRDSWLSTVASVINSKKASGLSNYDGYEIWNEPDGTWQAANGDFYTQVWKPTYDLIRAEDPQARIIGPSYSYYNSTRMREFLTYCKNNNTLPDVISWHQWGSGGFNSAYDDYRALEASLGISPRAISINEYSSTTHAYEGSPGVSVPFIAKFERKKVESASISWWFTNLPGRLGSLLTANNEKGGGWWLYKWYGDMTGHMVQVTPPNDNSEGVDGFASIDRTQRYASIIIGGNTIGTVNVQVQGIPTFLGSRVNAKLEYVTWVDKDTPVASTQVISEREYSVTNGTISVPVNVTSQFYAYRLYVTSTQTGPDVQITHPTATDVFVTPASISIAATATDADGSVARVEFFNGDSLLHAISVAPYTYSWTGVQPGTYTIRAVATDNEGFTALDTVRITVREPQSPYGGTPAAIPGKIEAENYDRGGDGVAYNDSDPQNQGEVYRNDGVDITGSEAEGFKIGWTVAGEWLDYTVHISNEDVYRWTARVATGVDTAGFQLALNGVPISESVKITNTGSWDDYILVSGITTSRLPQGNSVLRLSIERSYVNVDWVEFEYENPVATFSHRYRQQIHPKYEQYNLLGRKSVRK